MEALNQHLILFKLHKLEIKNISYLKQCKHPIYTYTGKSFFKVLEKNNSINSVFIANYKNTHGSDIYIHHEDYDVLKNNVENEILRLSRSLTIGEIQYHGMKLSELLTLHLSFLYQDPFNDKLLKFQHQFIKSYAVFLYDYPKMHKYLYHHIKDIEEHFVYKHPLLTSILLISFLQAHKTFNSTEILDLFLVNYFKDLGMSLVTTKAYNAKKLNDQEKSVLSLHAKNSIKLLKDKLPFTPDQLSIIENHHFLNSKIQEYINNKPIHKDRYNILGFESYIITTVDAFVALTSERPYRKPRSLFETMQIFKHVLSEEYSQDYKEFLSFVNKFLA